MIDAKGVTAFAGVKASTELFTAVPAAKAGRRTAADAAEALGARLVAAGMDADRLKGSVADAAVVDGLEQKLATQRRELDRKAMAEKLQQAKARLQMLQLRARMAMASGDTREAARAARDAAAVAREVGLAVQDAAKAAGRSGDQPQAEAVEAASADSAPVPAAAGPDLDTGITEARAIIAQARSLLALAGRLRGRGRPDGEQDEDLRQAEADLRAGDSALHAAADVPEAQAAVLIPGQLLETTA